MSEKSLDNGIQPEVVELAEDWNNPRTDNVEKVELYRPGGYHPVDVGDFAGQYTIIHKLG